MAVTTKKTTPRYFHKPEGDKNEEDWHVKNKFKQKRKEDKFKKKWKHDKTWKRQKYGGKKKPFHSKKDGESTEPFQRKKTWQSEKRQIYGEKNITLHSKKDGESTEPFQREEPWQSEDDPFPGPAPIAGHLLKKFYRGEAPNISIRTIKSKFISTLLKKKEDKIKDSIQQAARAELLLNEEAGYIEVDDGEDTADVTQEEITTSVDIASAAKHFNLNLDKFGPYRLNYNRNGRFLLLGGRKGHVASFDWITKKLTCEINVMEVTQDVQWLHVETMFAVAQKEWVHIYDNLGIELHCIKKLDRVLRMEFLPYHFLLTTLNEKGFLSWLDVSVGSMVVQFPTKQGRSDVMTQNTSNAILHLGHPNGTVTLWSPMVKEPLVKILCHNTPVKGLAITQNGNYMATSGIERFVKIWDLRTYKQLQSYRLPAGVTNLAFSQKDLLAATMGNVVEIYRDCCIHTIEKPYLHYKTPKAVSDLQFCPFEDILGLGHQRGFSSILVPGSGEPNFDAYEINPYHTKRQRQEMEVKSLLEKIQPELISLDKNVLAKIDEPTMLEKLEAAKKSYFRSVPPIEFRANPNKKTKTPVHIRTQKVIDERKRVLIRKAINNKEMAIKKLKKKTIQGGALSRFY